ncbi:sulfite exporter TauE/SafE family protein [Candidatus Woesearchaeota archaeon]|nr:sulfite exporter TauE/SafE family protein [Candidatus Woesearchaeota archaeon]
MVEVTIIAAFIAGIVSFLSPCVLPLVPGFLAYLSGITLGEKPNRWKLFGNSVAYVLGFSVIFALLGVLLNTVLENISYVVQEWLARIGGIIIILFGLYLLGLIKIPYLLQEHKLQVKKKFSITYVTSFVFGAAFAVGWSPCVGAILGSVFALAVTQPGLSFFLLVAYSLGLGIPFLIVGLFSEQALNWIRKFTTFMRYFNIIVGIFLIALGILVFTQTVNQVANFELLNNLLLK